MNPKEIILNAFARADKERGLRIIAPDFYLSTGHLKKADHNLIVMTDLNNLRHEDWVVTAAYYAMYQAATALLTKIGLHSKEHAATVAVLEHFFGKQLEKEVIENFNGLKQKKDKIEAITVIEEKYINYLWKAKSARETAQYGISITYKETDNIIANARDFVSKIKLVLEEIDEKLIETLHNTAKELKQSSEK
jgi:uncharacterized protein (UPF0332 family)